jgi:hypothetical protein
MSVENRENTGHSILGIRNKMVLLLAVLLMMLTACIIIDTESVDSSADRFDGNPAYSSLSSQQKVAYSAIYDLV